MLIIENLIINNKEYIRTWSDEGFMIERDGNFYEEAIDPACFGRTYTETDKLIESEEDMNELQE